MLCPAEGPGTGPGTKHLTPPQEQLACKSMSIQLPCRKLTRLDRTTVDGARIDVDLKGIQFVVLDFNMSTLIYCNYTVIPCYT